MSLRSKGVLLAASVLALAGAPASAAEKIVFDSGATMVVQGHTVDPVKQMIRLDLGNGSFITFPVSMVESIESGGRNLPILPPSGDVANRTVGGTASSGTFQYGPSPDFTPPSAPPPVRSASERRRQMYDAEQQLAWSQQSDTRQGVPAPGIAGQNLRAMGQNRPAQVDDPAGASPSGNLMALPSQPLRRTFPTIQPRGAAPPPPAPPPATPTPDAGSGSTSSADSGSEDPSNP